jgi:glucose-1-phosphate thymidylyltransferase
MIIVLFEDEAVAQLYPVTVGKPAFSIACGSYRLIDQVAQLERPVRVIVRPHLVGPLEADGRAVGLPDGANPEGILFVNARLAPSVTALAQVRSLMLPGRTGVWRQKNQAIVAAHVAAGTSIPLVNPNIRELTAYLSGLPALEADAEMPLFDYPHDIVKQHLVTLGANLEHRLATGRYEEIADGVFVGRNVKLGQYLVTDTSKGPIVIEENASVGPHCYLSGPAHLGPGSRVIEQAAIKDGVAIGHTTKIGGEVEGSVIEPYTNKQHHGFLGHSYLGSWVNLGAGTCNSDLKNTYGIVNMDYHGHKVSSGMQFLGCFVGDYAKTAINTSIFTGKVVGACSMLYGFVTTNVPSFVNYARSFGQVTDLPVEVMVATQARMFARRSVTQRPCDIQLLYDMYELTRSERQIAGEPLAL